MATAKSMRASTCFVSERLDAITNDFKGELFHASGVKETGEGSPLKQAPLMDIKPGTAMPVRMWCLGSPEAVRVADNVTCQWEAGWSR